MTDFPFNPVEKTIAISSTSVSDFTPCAIAFSRGFSSSAKNLIKVFDGGYIGVSNFDEIGSVYLPRRMATS
jgi:hypothetical protein